MKNEERRMKSGAREREIAYVKKAESKLNNDG